MAEVNCMNCCVGAFKHDLCLDKFCNKYASIGNSDEFIKKIEMGRNTGSWLEHYTVTATGGLHRSWRCSECDALVAERKKFCAECGAKMEVNA